MQETLKKHSIKIQLGTAFTILCFVAFWSFVISAQHTTMFEMIEDAQALAESNTAHIHELQEASQDNEISLAEINTNLKNIDKTLMEIKLDLKDHDRLK